MLLYRILADWKCKSANGNLTGNIKVHGSARIGRVVGIPRFGVRNASRDSRSRPLRPTIKGHGRSNRRERLLAGNNYDLTIIVLIVGSR